MKPHYKAIGDYGTLGIEIALCIIFGAGGGHWLDGKLRTEPWLMILGFFFGLGAAGKAVHQAWKQMQREAEREEREQGNPTPLWEKRDEEKKKADDEARARENANANVSESEDEDDHGQE
jgi:ATP synthase protein I